MVEILCCTRINDVAKDRINTPIVALISQYNAEIRGLYNFDSFANNVVKRIAKYRYFHYYSLVKTIANKYKTTVRKAIAKYGIAVARKSGTGT
jgi:hypothetical protein